MLLSLQHKLDLADNLAERVSNACLCFFAHVGKGRRYAELQVTSHLSSLGGAPSCEELFATAVVLGIDALAVVNRDFPAGVVRAHESAKTTGVRLVVGCALTSWAKSDWPAAYGVLILAANEGVAPYHDRQIAVLTQHSGPIGSTPPSPMKPFCARSRAVPFASHELGRPKTASAALAI